MSRIVFSEIKSKGLTAEVVHEQQAEAELVDKKEPEAGVIQNQQYPFETRSSLKNKLVNFIATLIIGIAVVSFWRGSWILADIYIFPSTPEISATTSIVVSYPFLFLILLVQPTMLRRMRELHPTPRSIIWRVLFYVLGLAAVLSWRGVWLALDVFTSTSVLSAAICHTIGFLTAVITRSTASLIPPPGFVLSDKILHNFNLSLGFLYKVQNPSSTFKKYFRHVIKCFITVFIIGVSVVVYWRGTWTLMDNIPSPMEELDQLLFGALLSSGIGVVLYSICYWVSEPLGTYVAHATWPYVVQACVEHVFLYVLGFAVVNFWRGFWNLGNIYLIPDNLPLSSALCHAVGAGLLFLGYASVNLLSPPAGCRSHSKKCLEGFYIGSYISEAIQPPVIPHTEQNTGCGQNPST
ncbi:uncharacterized protein LOC116616125 [Nematostella vectensis]|uniref:uncharacterized protein LOC116616125 n=1 Tax=Nematostella vectensis TaxID=45351 RepID=UPI001390662A|nr:uncharacterized protein LOC116616125 [Nematostella vectensis]